MFMPGLKFDLFSPKWVSELVERLCYLLDVLSKIQGFEEILELPCTDALLAPSDTPLAYLGCRPQSGRGNIG